MLRKSGWLPAASRRRATSPASLAAILRGAPARGKQARGAGLDRRFGEHRRVAGLMAPVVALAAEVEGAQVELIDGVGDEIGQMIFGQPIARRRRRQERLLGLIGPAGVPMFLVSLFRPKHCTTSSFFRGTDS